MEYKKKWYNTIIVSYTLSFIIVSLMVFGCFAIYHKSFIMDVDAFMQHYPLLVKLRHMCGDLLRGNGFAFWSQDIGLGSDTIGNMAIIICDPFNYIAAAFPKKYMDLGYSLAVLLRMYTAGWTMIAFLKYHRYTKKSCLIGGIGYAYCSWAVGVIRHGFFLNPLILFPLLILGIDYIFDKKKPYLLIFSVGMSLITYLYFAYMSAIFCFLYVVVRFWLGEHDMEKKISEFLCLVGRLILLIIVACMLSAPVLLTMLYVLMNAGKTTGAEFSFILSLKDAIHYLPSLICNIEVNGNYSFTGMNALFLTVVPFMFIYRKKKQLKVPVVFFIFCMLMTAFPLWGKIMNGFSYSVGRWCYVLAFFFVWAAIGTLEEMEKDSSLNKKAFYLWIMILAVWLMLGKALTSAISYPAALIGLWNLVMMVVMFWMLTEDKRKYLYLLLLFNIGGVYYLSFSPYAGNGISCYMDFKMPYKIYEKSVLRAEKTIEDSDFYRVDFNEHINKNGNYYTNTSTTPNENMYWSSRTLFSYLSTLDSGLLKLNKDLENSAGYYRRMTVFSNDNRSRLNFLEGVKYYLSNEKDGTENYAGYGYSDLQTEDGVRIQKAGQDAGLGYVYSNVISENEYDSYSALDKEQSMMQAAVVSEKDIEKFGLDTKIINQKQICFDTEEVPYTVDPESQIQPEGNHFELAGEKRTLQITIPQCENCELYVEFQGLKKEPVSLKEFREQEIGEDSKTSRYQKVMFNRDYLSYQPYNNFEYYVAYGGIQKKVLYAAGDNQGLTDQTSFLSNLGYFEQAEGKISITFTVRGRYSYDSLKVYAVSQQHFDEQAGKLTEQRVTMTKQTVNSIRGTVNAKQDGVLYLSLPYHPGWKISVDGENQEMFRVNTNFCGICIAQGEHEIVLTYQPIAYIISLIACFVGIICIIGLILVKKHGSNIRNRKK